jgi:radical SAM protein with 4Fe4S-binding SPASM domain
MMSQQPQQLPEAAHTVKRFGLEVTGRCNLHCRHCFNRSGGDVQQDLSLEVVERILGEAHALGAKYLRLSGGEPTMHRDFAAVVRAARKLAMTVSINSNGLYSEAVWGDVLEAQIDRFILSLDGLRVTNDAIRGAGVFDQVVETGRRLVGEGRGVTLGVHLCRTNYQDVEGLVELAARLGVSIKFSPVRPLGRAQQMRDEILTPAQFYQVVRRVTELRCEYPSIKIVTDFDILEQAAASQPADPKRSRCLAGHSLNIGFDGYVYPCAFLATPQHEFAAGHISEKSLADMYRNAPVFHRFRTLGTSQRCQSCFAYRRSCVGGCPAMAYFSTGDLESHDPTCFVDYVVQAK